MATPIPSSRGPGALPILVGGAISSVATLALVWFLGRTFPDFNIMPPGWFAGKEGAAKSLRESAETGTAAAKAVEGLLTIAQQPDATTLKEALAEIAKDSKAASKLPKRFAFRLLHCPGCHEGQLEVQLLEGQGNQLTTTEMGAVPVLPDVVSAVLRG